MKSEEIRPNSVLFSERFGRYGQVLRKKGFMCLTLFVKHGAVWLPASDLHEMCPKYAKRFKKS